MKTFQFVGLLHLALLTVFLAHVPSNAIADGFDAYRYELEAGMKRKVCQHMKEIYNRDFRTPWDFRGVPIKTPPFPRLPGVEYDELQALKLRFSAFPTTPEFEAVPWKEGRYLWNPQKNERGPMLAAVMDLNNDGQQELLVKTSFMLSVWPGGGGAPGGMDRLFILNTDRLDLSQYPTPTDFYGHAGKTRPAMIDHSVLGLSARSIRPFVYEGVAYMSVYEQYAIRDPKRRRETMWVLKYIRGGSNLGDGKWEPVEVSKICRFRMIAE